MEHRRRTRATVVNRLVIIGDSWTCGEWRLENQALVINHPGLTNYLPYNTTNLSQSGSSNWKTLFTMYNYMKQQHGKEQSDYAVLLCQTDTTRTSCAEEFDVDINTIVKQADSLEQLYVSLAEIFYMKISVVAEQYNIPVYIIGGVSDVDENIFSLYNNKDNIICSSWVNLLYPDHKNSVMPLEINSNTFALTKKVGRYDLCDQMLEYDQKRFAEFNEVLSLDTMGPGLANFHPNRQGHKLMAEKITNFIEKQANA